VTKVCEADSGQSEGSRQVHRRVLRWNFG
jgi:hypothetical protein